MAMSTGRSVRRSAPALLGPSSRTRCAPIDESVAAVETAVRAGAAEGVPIVLNARTDVHLPDTGLDRVGRLDAAKSRGMTFLAGGADRIFVPGCSHPDEIGELVNCFGPGRLSLLAKPGVPNPAELQSLGVSRVSYAPTTAMGRWPRWPSVSNRQPCSCASSPTGPS